MTDSYDYGYNIRFVWRRFWLLPDRLECAYPIQRDRGSVLITYMAES